MTARRFRQLLNARFAGVLLSALSMMLAGCATSPQLADATEASLPMRANIEGVPFHAQQEYQCGPASLAMVLNSQGVDVAVDTLIPQVFIPDREGSVQPEMLATTRRHGLIPYVLNNSFDALLIEIAAGHPVVVMQNLALPAWPMWHYAVAIGYDREAEELILHSGEEPERIESFRRFDATWARSDRWAFVALPAGQLPEAIGAYRALDAIASFEQVQGAQAALPAWEALVSRFPTSAMGHFALGNARHGIGDMPGAIDAFREAVHHDDEFAVAWLNLGLSLKNQGSDEEAQRALSRAADIPGQWQAQAQEALKTY
ncbi:MULTISPECIES: PA2778 family cysteine peptidase [Halomonas]|uniref:Tetratricopeptide repeat protein n=1 Tax=Halomonas chromatireducens TaxID=507626 RepID=A0A0X8HCA5_9GAMM|nr:MULTISPECIES: PA2778 family cysteine peptidase [Halomonas]AMD00018.1 Tetratricopeptide repeat protein [Halomonas chromatireducens]MBZ0329174.1 PA2778 family cysteine peptidase [Halomonas sp. ANAO-440]